MRIRQHRITKTAEKITRAHTSKKPNDQNEKPEYACLTDDGESESERTHARLYIYVAVSLIDLKTKYYKDRRGLERKRIGFFYLFLFYIF